MIGQAWSQNIAPVLWVGCANEAETISSTHEIATRTATMFSRFDSWLPNLFEELNFRSPVTSFSGFIAMTGITKHSPATTQEVIVKGIGKQMDHLDAFNRTLDYVCGGCGEPLGMEKLPGNKAIVYCTSAECTSKKYRRIVRPKPEYHPTAADAAWDRMQEKIKMQPLKALGE